MEMVKTYPQPVAYGESTASSRFRLSLHHLQLAIPPGSENKCRAFYIGILGMTEVAKPPELAKRGGLWLRSGDLEIHLGVEAHFRPARKAHPGILARELDDLARHLESSGVEVAWDGGFPGFRRFYVHDNSGNRLEFLAPEGFDENG
jgi:catechol 2,3-dioxygenase-like lactoylglutathione lyase family enzyme